MKDNNNRLWDKVKNLPVIARIAGGVCIAAVIAAIVLIVCIVNQNKEQEEPLAESQEPVEESRTQVTETESETQEAEVVVNEEEVPTFTECQLTAESLERDLDIYITDKAGQPISGVPFRVKLIPVDKDGKIMIGGTETPNGEESTRAGGETDETVTDPLQPLVSDPYTDLQEAVDLVEQVSAEQRKLQEQMGEVDFSTQEYEQILIQKKNALEIYMDALAGVPDPYYDDTDKDGGIHAQDVREGQYALCFMPVENPKAALALSMVEGEEPDPDNEQLNLYDSTAYAQQVLVKGKTDYQVIQYIDRRMNNNSSSSDKREEHKDVKVEKPYEDTVDYSDEFLLYEHSDYTELKISPSKLGIRAGVSDKLEETRLAGVRKTSQNTAGDQETEEAQTQEVEAYLAVSDSVQLYASKDASASTVKLPYTAREIEKVELSASEEIAEYLKIEQDEDSFTVSLKNPGKVLDDESGLLTLTGETVSGEQLSVLTKVSITGGEKALKYKKKKLYTQNEKNKMVRATVGNYSLKNKYYIAQKTDKVTYYGWHTEGGNHYFYDENSQLVKGKQRIGGVSYTFDDKTGKLLSASVGVDVSSWQGDIDWEQASYCVTSAMIRCGFRGTDGRLGIDSKCLSNVHEARKNNIQTGIYFHSRAATEAQAVEEASLAVSMAKTAGSLNFPIYIELDSDKHGGISREQRTSIVGAFCRTIQKGGYRAGVVASKTQLEETLTVSSLGNVSVWCRQYNKECTYKGSYAVWQYTDKGRVPGIDGYVDLNIRK